jgi:hypothetical protein
MRRIVKIPTLDILKRFARKIRNRVRSQRFFLSLIKRRMAIG